MTNVTGHVEHHEWVARRGGASRVAVLPAAPLEITALFPEIEIGPPLSRCGDHDLYSARVREGQAPCLILLVPASTFQSAEHLARFLAGMRHIQSLANPHLLTLLWVGERQGNVCLGYEAFEGTPLFEVMDHFTLDPRTVVGITSALGSALQLAHEQGIIYRDLTPGALLLNRVGFPKLAGLGLSVLLYPDGQEFFAALLGRPRYLHAYLAPEQVHQQGTPPDALMDVHALGAITYELFVGHPPAGLAMPPSSRAPVGTYVDQVVFRAVHSSREERYHSAAAFGTDIQSIYAAHSNEYVRGGEQNPLLRPAAAPRKKKKSSLAWMIILGALAVGVGSTLLWLRLHPTDNRAAMANQAKANAKADALQKELAKALSAKKDGMSKDEKEALLAVVSTLVRNVMDMAPSALKTDTAMDMMEKLMQAGEDEISLDALLKMQLQTPPDSVDWRKIEAMTQLMRGGRAGLEKAQSAAAKARKAGDARQERMELARAAGFIPGRMGLAALARENKYNPLPLLEPVLRKMKGGPGGGPVRYAIRARDLELQVDLSGNPGLTDLSPLIPFPITHLDISRTRVADLSPLSRMPLQLLQLDDTPVVSLVPVTGGCLRLLTAENCAISNLGSIDQCLVMTGYRVMLRNGTLHSKSSTAHWGRTWVNGLGGVFLPVADRSSLLVARNEVLVRDFVSYQRHTAAAPRFKGESPLSKGPLRQPPDFPITRLTAAQVMDFCAWLTERERDLGLISRRATYRLLTPREWNQAAGLYAANLPGGSPLAGSGPLFTLGGNLPPAADLAAMGRFPGLTPPAPSHAATWRTLMGIQDLGNGVREWGQAADPAASLYPVKDLPPGPGDSSFLVPSEAQLAGTASPADLGFRLVLQLPPVFALEE